MVGTITAQPPVFIQKQQTSQKLNDAPKSQIVQANELGEEEEKVVRELKKRDKEVRAHEQAHKSAGGPYASAPSFETVTGPDGKEYAVGGEVQIDSSPISGDPEATIRKLSVVIRAALAPSQPSSQDVRVATQAQQAIIEAQAQIYKQDTDEGEATNNIENPEGSESNSPFQVLSDLLQQNQSNADGDQIPVINISI